MQVGRIQRRKIRPKRNFGGIFDNDIAMVGGLFAAAAIADAFF